MMVWKCDMCKKEIPNKATFVSLTLSDGEMKAIQGQCRKVIDMSSKREFDICQRCADILFDGLGSEE